MAVGFRFEVVVQQAKLCEKEQLQCVAPWRAVRAASDWATTLAKNMPNSAVSRQTMVKRRASIGPVSVCDWENAPSPLNCP
jgi:hypothetical protein